MAAGPKLWLFSVLCLAAGLPPTQLQGTAANQQPGTAANQQAGTVDDQQPCAADQQLSQLLEPLVERAVERAVGRVVERAVERSVSRSLANGVDWSSSSVLTSGAEMARLQDRLRELDRGLADMKLAVVSGDQERGQQRERVLQSKATLEPEPEPEPPCENHPNPLPDDQAPHRQPAVLACARSCLQLRDQVSSPQDGVYWFTAMPVPTLCDFSHDGGGWTLLLTATSRDGWNLLSVLNRRERSPSLDDNYSILRHGDTVRDLGIGDRFAYRIETQAEKGRQRWGGVWFAPRSYSFVHETPSQTQVFIVKRFDKWQHKVKGIRRRMPWLNMHGRTDFSGNDPAVLTTAERNGPAWGTLLEDEHHGAWHHSPWSPPEATNTGRVLYWVREETL